MRTERVARVADTSAVILLQKIGLLDVLALGLDTESGDCVGLPTEVVEELTEHPTGLATLDELGAKPWIVLGLEPSTQEVLRPGLAAGETATIQQGKARGCPVILDDMRGRRVARELGVAVVGTLGLLVEARRRGAIERLAPVLERLGDAGMWISPEVIETVLASVGESPGQ